MKAILILTTILSLIINISTMFIECEYKIHPTYGYGCEGMLNEVKSSSNFLKYIKGKHLEDMKQKDVKFFMANNSEIIEFPAGLAFRFKSLLTINLDLPNLKRICNEDLKPFEKLRNLILRNNQIEFISADLFQSNPDLSYIYFSSENMKSIQRGAFKPIKNLKALFVKFGCEDEDATNSDQVQDLIQKLEISCYDPAFTVPSPCKEKRNYKQDDHKQHDDINEDESEVTLKSENDEPSTNMIYWIVGAVCLIIGFIAVVVVRIIYKK